MGHHSMVVCLKIVDLPSIERLNAHRGAGFKPYRCSMQALVEDVFGLFENGG